MHKVVLDASGPVVAEAASPTPAEGEVLVRVRAAGLNRADLLIADGAFHGGMGGLGASLGLECAGEIVTCGDGVTGWSVGDRVMVSGRGAFAEFVTVPAAMLWSAPGDLTWEQAACLPIALQTTHDAIVTNGDFQPARSMLVLGASSGVGLMALQLGRLLGASLVIGTSTTEERRARLKDFGADLAIDTRADDWAGKVLDATAGEGVDLVIDFLSGSHVAEAMAATRLGGRIVNVGRLAGAHATFDFDLHARRRLTYIGVTFRTRTSEQVEEVSRRAQADLAEPLRSGMLRLPVDAVYPLADVRHAYEHMRTNTHFGKIAIRVD